MKASPKWGMLLLVVVSSGLYFGLAAWGWGGWSALMAHPARAGSVIVGIVASIASLFTRGSISSGKREDTKNRWIFLPILALGLLLAWLPAYTDRNEIWSIDGDAARYAGLAMYTAGMVFRIGPVFVLGRRFSGLVAIQEGHELVISGFYRLIRHPSYLGLLLTVFGWALIFRSGIGVLLSLLFVPILVSRMNSEEALLASEFGEQYAAYRRRTWRLVPFVY
jgi:protein-S-isoprenylcysteine O-methyltransferase Ste14